VFRSIPRAGAGSRRLLCRPTRRLIPLFIVSVGFAPSWAWAGDWEISPSVSLYQSFTSNGRLAPPGDEKADFFTTLSPAIAIHRDSPRLNLDLNYALDAVAYVREQELSELRNQLEFASTATLVPEMVFLDGFAAIEQQPTETGRTGSGSSLAAATDLTTVYTYSLSPYLDNHFGSFADSELRYTFNQVLSEDLTNSTAHRAEATLVSGSQFPRLLWTLNASGEEASSSRDISTRFAAASVEYRLSRVLGLLASVGYERISDATLDQEPDGPIGSAGLRLTPGPRTSVTLTYNHRFDSDFFAGSASYLLGPQTRIDATYTERLETSQTLFADNLSFLTRDEFGNFVDSRTARLFTLGDPNFGLQDNAFRLRAFNMALHAVRGRNVFDAVGYYERRDIDATNERDTAAGGALNWAHLLTPVTSLSLTARYRYDKFETVEGTDDQQLIGASASVLYHLNETLDGVIGVSFTRQFADVRSNEFAEAVVSIGLVKRF
jgi:uncharacterized protein (PEP-CTERM system associated)